jgi:hypothetical protein
VDVWAPDFLGPLVAQRFGGAFPPHRQIVVAQKTLVPGHISLPLAHLSLHSGHISFFIRGFSQSHWIRFGRHGLASLRKMRANICTMRLYPFCDSRILAILSASLRCKSASKRSLFYDDFFNENVRSYSFDIRIICTFAKSASFWKGVKVRVCCVGCATVEGPAT